MIIAFFAPAVLCLLPLSGPHIDQNDVDDLMKMSLTELLSIEVSVASKSDETAADAPSSVTVFTQAEMRHLGIRSLLELLNFVPGFQSTLDVEQGRAARVSARGKSSALSESVLFLIDGQRINDLYTGGISIINRMPAFEHIKQVEVIRGPGSALYGSNAFMGVVNIVTARGFRDAGLSLGSGEARSGHVNMSHTVGDTQVSAFAKVWEEEGVTFADVEDVFSRVRTTRDPGRGMDLYAQVTHGDFQASFRHMSRAYDDFITFGAVADGINRERTAQTSLNARYRLQFDGGGSLDLSLGYLRDRWDTLALLIPKDLEIAPGFALSEHFVGGPYLESDQLVGHADYGMQRGRHQFKTGLSLARARLTDVANQMSHHPILLEYQGDITRFDDDATSFNRLESREIIGVYLQDKVAFSDNFDATLGVRFDRYSDFGSAFNPRAALIYRASPRNTFKLMYGTAFRAPNFLELYDRNNPVDFGNPDLDAETVRTTELAWVRGGDRLNTTLTLFHNELEDVIYLGDPVSDPQNPLEAPGFYNGDATSNKGLELELRAALTEGLLLYAAYTRFQDGDVVALPESFGGLALTYRLAALTLNLNGIWRGTQADLPQQDAYWVAGGGLGYQVGEQFTLKLNMRNLFDEAYVTPSTAAPTGVPNRGRTAYLQAGYSF